MKLRTSFLIFATCVCAYSGVAANNSKIRKFSQQAEAQFEAGRNHLNGQGVPQDDSKAFASFLKAAEAGHPKAQNNVAAMYLDGRGVKPSDALAVLWFRKS